MKLAWSSVGYESKIFSEIDFFNNLFCCNIPTIIIRHWDYSRKISCTKTECGLMWHVAFELNDQFLEYICILFLQNNNNSKISVRIEEKLSKQ